MWISALVICTIIWTLMSVIAHKEFDLPVFNAVRTWGLVLVYVAIGWLASAEYFEVI